MFKLSAAFGVMGGTGLVLAQALPLPDPKAFDDVSITAILAFLVCVSLAMNFYLMKQFFCTLQKHTEQLQKSADAQVELCARMNQRPCLFKKKE